MKVGTIAIPQTASHIQHPCPQGRSVNCSILTIARNTGVPAKKTRLSHQNVTNLNDRCGSCQMWPCMASMEKV